MEGHKSKYWWIEYFFYSLVGYFIPIWARFLEFPKWKNPSFFIDGERLMATHDAYYFLAGALGTARSIDQPLSILIKFLSHLTNLPLATVGFFFPVFASALIVIPLLVLAKRFKFPEASMAACILGACCIGYLGRTRLGFLDTDSLVMFFNITFLAGLAIWIEEIREKERVFSEKFIIKTTLVGLLGSLFKWFYGAGTPIIWGAIIIGYGVLLVDTFLQKQDKQFVLLFSIGFCLLISIVFFPLLGIASALLSFIILRFFPNVPIKQIYAGIILIFLVVFVAQKLYYLPYNILQYALSLAKIKGYVVEQNKTAVLSLPDVNQSIKELQNIPLNVSISRMAFNKAIFVVGVLGLLYATYKRLSLGIFLVLLLLGLSSVKFGNRFTMYGGVVVGLGLGLGSAFLLQDLFKNRFNKLARLGVQIAICFILSLYVFKFAARYFPNPVLPPIYAKTFKEVGKISPANARLWQWWDYGYAGQYYAKRTTFGDGGAHDGPFLYPAALVHTTSSPRQASNLIKFITKKQWEEYVANKTKYDENMKDSPPMWRYALIDPMKPFAKMGDEGAEKFIDKLKTGSIALPKDYPPQYVVFSWENLKIAYWISYFGTWDFLLKTGNPGKIQQVRGNIKIDIENGKITINGRKKIPLQGLIAITPKGPRTFQWDNLSGFYGVLNQLSHQFYIMDGTIYFSNMIQMLLGNPKKHYPGFELVIDNFPWNRVYKVK